MLEQTNINKFEKDFREFFRNLIVKFPDLPKEKEIEILINDYSKSELAQIILIAIEVIREKNKFIENVKD